MRLQPQSAATALARALPAAVAMPTRTRRLVSILSGAVAAVLTLYLVYAALPLPSVLVVDKWVFLGLLGSTVALCLTRVLLVAADRGAWIAITAGLTLWTLGETYWAFALADVPEPARPAPSLADAGWLLFYPAAYVGLGLLARRRLGHFPAAAWLDGSVVALGTGALAAAFILPPIIAGSDGSFAAVTTTLAYPLADLVLFAVVMGLFALTGWHPGRTWFALGLGFATSAVADALYLYQVATATYSEGSLVDALWPLAMFCFALAAWQPAETLDGTRSREWPALAVPGLAVLVALGLLVYGHFGPLELSAVMLAALTVLAAGVRTLLAYREIRELAHSRRLALTDQLTGLGNRRFLYEELERAIAQARAANLRASLLVIDLDRFKELNDTLGHQVGDRLLEQIGPRLAEALPKGSSLARLGGDEFAALLPLGTGVEPALEVALAVREAVKRPFALSALHVEVDASVGVALFPDHGDSGETLLRRADIAMYQAKDDRTGAQIYARDRDDHSRDRLVLVGELRGAAARDELVVHYQPKADMETGAVHGVEALVRWQHPTRGLLQPGEFLPIAEETALMAPLTLHVLERSLRQVAAWRQGGIHLDIAVNVTAHNLLDLRFPEAVTEALHRFGLGPELLQLEITEDTVMSDPERVLDVLARMGELGVRSSLDDFGTGQSSLARLKRLPVEEIKIDRSFVLGMGGDRTDRAIVRSTIELARSLELRVVAEGVENVDTWRELARLGCDQAQGYFLSRPVPASELTGWLRRRHDEASSRRLAEPPVEQQEGVER